MGYKSDFMTYCTNKLYGLMFARELATRLKVLMPCIPVHVITPFVYTMVFNVHLTHADSSMTD